MVNQMRQILIGIVAVKALVSILLEFCKLEIGLSIVLLVWIFAILKHLKLIMSE